MISCMCGSGNKFDYEACVFEWLWFGSMYCVHVFVNYVCLCTTRAKWYVDVNENVHRWLICTIAVDLGFIFWGLCSRSNLILFFFNKIDRLIFYYYLGSDANSAHRFSRKLFLLVS